jgi:protein TIF31
VISRNSYFDIAYEIFQFYTEFADAVKAGALAISEGHIAPINPMDEEKTQVYVYNNIFYSRAVDTKENFKVCIVVIFLGL